jgi:hypothetical protein
MSPPPPPPLSMLTITGIVLQNRQQPFPLVFLNQFIFHDINLSVLHRLVRKTFNYKLNVTVSDFEQSHLWARFTKLSSRLL